MNRALPVSLLVLLFSFAAFFALSLVGCSEDRTEALPTATPGEGETETAPGETTLEAPDPGDAIATAIFERAGQFAEGMEPATVLFRGTLETGGTQGYQAVLQPGQCFKVVGVGGEGVEDLDLLLFDQNGVQVRQDVARDNYPVLGLSEPICPQTPGMYRVQVRMFRGQGEFGVQVFQTPPR